jgi:hypothetical protein
MNLVYIDDSKDEKCSIFSALSIPEENWQKAFQMLKGFRKEIKKSDGIYVYKELHAWEFVSGRGKIADNIVFKSRRCAIFDQTLTLIASLPGARLFNTVSPPGKDEISFEWLLNRINIFSCKAKNNAILICDQGKEKSYTRLRRRMGSYNPIPSQYQKWSETGAFHKNIPINNIVEDPFFKDSSQSYFIQLADFCAYALLRRENPLPSKNKYGLDKSFALLSGILVREASRKDPEGIIRIQ